MAKIALLYGFCEGPRMAGKFLRALERAGHTIVRDPHQADVLIAHSGGCFLATPELPAQQIIFIGLTYWPGKSILRALVQKNWNDFHAHRSERSVREWLHKFSWNLMYFWNMPHNIAMLRGMRSGRFWEIRRLTVIRNEEDSFCTPDLAGLPFAHRPATMEVPGQHDDCWRHPAPYLTAIQ